VALEADAATPPPKGRRKAGSAVEPARAQRSLFE